ncbi:hypothetical protein V6Z12_A06G063900 [Gossypium hirsutum]
MGGVKFPSIGGKNVVTGVRFSRLTLSYCQNKVGVLSLIQLLLWVDLLKPSTILNRILLILHLLTWKNIWATKAWRVGNGTSISVWHDCWLSGTGPFKVQSPKVSSVD